MNEQQIEALNNELCTKSPREILKYALNHFSNIAISFSGAEDVVLIEMAKSIGIAVEVFSLDTGRLHPETYRFFEKVREHYQVNIHFLSPDATELEAFTQAKGLFSFYKDGHSECCAIRKVKPLKRKLATLDAWITGQRKDQSPGTRAEVPVVQLDKGNAGAGKTLIKFNPLANWTSKDVWDYIRMTEAPYNSLHERGFISIGCEPCTKPVLPNQHEREGRWWWEEATQKECGLHQTNHTK